MAGRSALNAEMRVQILLWHPMPCGVTATFRSLKAKIQVQILAGQLGGHSSWVSAVFPPISHSCSPIGRGDYLKNSHV
jgi:hypothetical protein